ncbi:MAG: O-antigen ligase family protein [Patescibacteria group bacterium]
MKRSLLWFLGIIAAEALSATVVFHPTINTVCAFVIAAVVAVLAWRRPSMALAILATEYVLGSKGALFNAFGNAENNGGVSIRILLFAAFFVGWFAWAVQNKTYRAWQSYLVGRRLVLALAIVVAYAFLIGVVRHTPFLLADANAWGAWLLLLPTLDLARHDRDRLKQWMLPAMLAAAAWMPLKTLALFYFFSHGFPEYLTTTVYLWVRRTGVGEVTRVVGSTYRVFFQSHLYAIPAVIGAWLYVGESKEERGLGMSTKWAWGIGIAWMAVMIVSLSRSLFLGWIAGVLFCLYYVLRRKGKKFLEKAINKLIIIFGATLLVFVVLAFPFPQSGGSMLDLVKSRANITEDAAMSRWKLLPVLWEGISVHPLTGSGFGSTITYESKDPRVVSATGGRLTTYAFEWGWLDLWLKGGLLLPLILFAMLVCLGYRFWREKSLPEWLRLAGVSSILALAVTHVFTPYLNHPLGIVYLIAAEALLEWSKEE